MPFDLDPGLFALLIVAAIFAGWIDAVVGGGGLVQLPALLVAFPTAPPALMLGTNKMASVCGTTVSAFTYARKIPLEHRLLWPTVGLALLGSGAGAVAALTVAASALKPIIIAVLLAVLVLVITRPRLGLVPQPKLRTPLRGAALMVAAGVGVAFYDGMIGPGTGIFLSIAFTAIIGFDYITAAAHTKVVNAATNLGSLVVFALQGNVWWVLGLTMGLGCMLGAWFGARTAMARGSGFVRLVLVIVVLALLARLSWDVWNTSRA
ncbi:TSUP family transporter [Glycomyces sp. TRM65418]|uniref:TSUP family transporter n=1 Tax=Glycomyces sp. TRM65418 TaxID=2867006 RepID=UPI001CE50C9B|nr:TSUP family transporter [Glycomyces sp. TRM65418]MCC3764587.1 TSUP family transporter [Glycomyces sp. TRM65418]QZD54251.1 TSUP family transporter [Glycomyces sp. TRM65418]